MMKGYCNDEQSFIKEVDSKDATWIHLTNPSRDEIKKLSEKFNIPTNYFTNVLDVDEIAREEYLEVNDTKKPKLVTFLYPIRYTNTQGYNVYNARTFSIILLENLIISASKLEPEFFKELFSHDTNYQIDLKNQESLILEIAWLISYNYICYLKEIHEAIDQLEEEVAYSMETKHLYHLLNLKKSLVFLDSGMESNHPVLKKIENISRFSTNNENTILLHNMRLENKQAETMIKQYYQLLDQIGDLFSSIISNRLNNLMKVLTSMSIILTIPAIIGALWGMNVPVPFGKSPFAFLLLLFASALLAGVVALLLKKKKYF